MSRIHLEAKEGRYHPLSLVMPPCCVPSAHLQPEKLERYLLQLLDAAEIEEMEVHLLLCHCCQQRAADLEEEITVLRLALSPGEEEHLPERNNQN